MDFDRYEVLVRMQTCSYEKMDKNTEGSGGARNDQARFPVILVSILQK